MNSPRLTALVPVLMVMALPLGAGEAGKTPAATPPLSAEQEAFWKEFQNGALSKAQIDAEAKYVTARAAFQDGRFVEARDLVDEAIRIFPSHAGAQQLREQILAVLTQRESRLSVATTLSQAQQNVKSQEIAVRLASLMDSGLSLCGVLKPEMIFRTGFLQAGHFSSGGADSGRFNVNVPPHALQPPAAQTSYS